MKLRQVLLIISFFPFLLNAQNKNFSISGHIKGLPAAAKVYLDYTDNAGNGKEDSCQVKNNSFHFSGQVKEVASCRMSLDHQGKGKPFSIYSPDADVIYFYFGAEDIKISSADSLSTARFSGSKVYDEHQTYLGQTGGSIMAQNKRFNTLIKNAGQQKQRDSLFLKAVNEQYRKALADRANKQFAYAKSHPKSYFALVALSESAGTKVDVDKIKPVYDALAPKLRNTDMGKELGQRINAVNSTEIGRPAPQFTQQDPNGKPVSLKDFRGKYVLIEFWASWCAPCRAGNPNLISQYKLYKDKGFDIISVSLDHVKKNWLEAIKADGLPWTQLCDLKGWNNEVGRLYGIRQVPSSILVDPGGIIIANSLRDESLNEKLAAIFTSR